MMKKVNTTRICIACLMMSLLFYQAGYGQQPDPAVLKMMPEIPSSMTTPTERAEYLVMHFWDKFDFKDTPSLMKNDLLERCFVDYLEVLSLVQGAVTEKSIQSLMKKAEVEKKNLLFVAELGEKYLNASSSPMYDEEKFIPILQCLLKTPVLNDVEKIRPQFLLDAAMTNRVGQVANDLTYTLADGKTGTLHAITANYTLLYFNDPDCKNCQTLIKQLAASPVITNLVRQQTLKIITVYPEDDLEAWKKHASEIPDTWIYSRDAEQKINMESLYRLNQFPTLYLLDKDKKVLLKDTTFEKLEDFFNHQ